MHPTASDVGPITGSQTIGYGKADQFRSFRFSVFNRYRTAVPVTIDNGLADERCVVFCNEMRSYNDPFTVKVDIFEVFARSYQNRVAVLGRIDGGLNRRKGFRYV